MSGYAERSGFEDREPVLTPLALADNVTGLTGAMAMMMALYHWDAKGSSGQVIDLSLLEPMYATLGPLASRYRLTGTVKKRVGSASSTSSSRNIYKTSDDRWVAMSASIPTMVTRLFRAIGREDMLCDPRYSTNAERFKHRHEVDAVVGGWIRERTLDEKLAFFRTHEITVGPVYNISKIVEYPHFIEREILVEAPDEEFGSLPMHNIFPRFSKTPGDFYRPAQPTLSCPSFAPRRQRARIRLRKSSRPAATRRIRSVSILAAAGAGLDPFDFGSHMRTSRLGVVASDAFTMEGPATEAVRVCLGGPISRPKRKGALEFVAHALEGSPERVGTFFRRFLATTRHHPF